MTREEIKEKLPYGYVKEVAKEAGVSRKSVSRFLNGFSKSHRIEVAALKIIFQIQEEKGQYTDRINNG